MILSDNLSSHITSRTLQLCEENNIKFICLVPNSTHLLQPLDVSYFSSLKTNWRKVLADWRKTRRGKVTNALPKEVFAKLLTKTLEVGADTAARNAIAGFKACGIYPFDPSVVLDKLKDYSKPMEEVREEIGEFQTIYQCNQGCRFATQTYQKISITCCCWKERFCGGCRKIL